MRFRRTAIVVGTVGIGSALGVAALPAGASPGQGAHFASASDSLAGDQLIATFREDGLGSSLPTEQLSAQVSVQYYCLSLSTGLAGTRGAVSEQQDSTEAAQSQPTNTDGQAVGTLELPPPVAHPCPDGQVNVGREVVQYTDVQLSDLTNGVTVSLPDQSYDGQTLP